MMRERLFTRAPLITGRDVIQLGKFSAAYLLRTWRETRTLGALRGFSPLDAPFVFPPDMGEGDCGNCG